MWKYLLLSISLIASSFAAEKMSAPQLIELAKTDSARLRDAIPATFDAKDLTGGTAWAGHGPDFFFAIQTSSQPSLVIDGAPGPAMQRLAGSDFWYAPARIEPVGRLHAFHYLINGQSFGGRLTCLPSDRFLICNREFRRGRYRPSSLTPARSTTE